MKLDKTVDRDYGLKEHTKILQTCGNFNNSSKIEKMSSAFVMSAKI